MTATRALRRRFAWPPLCACSVPAFRHARPGPVPRPPTTCTSGPRRPTDAAGLPRRPRCHRHRRRYGRLVTTAAGPGPRQRATPHRARDAGRWAALRQRLRDRTELRLRSRRPGAAAHREAVRRRRGLRPPALVPAAAERQRARHVPDASRGGQDDAWRPRRTDAGRGAGRSSSADAPGIDPALRVYSGGIVPALDRIVTTTTDMDGDSPASRNLQVWRLSDLRLLHTIALPDGPAGNEGHLTAEPGSWPMARRCWCRRSTAACT